MNLDLIRFISVILSITFTTHYFLFFSWSKFFTIHAFSVKLVLFVVVFFLSITFVLSSIFIHMSNNPFTRAYYLISGIWIGLMSFLLVGSTIVWIVKGGLLFLPHDLPAKTIIQSISCFLYGRFHLLYPFP
jgi:hypothetical protein